MYSFIIFMYIDLEKIILSNRCQMDQFIILKIINIVKEPHLLAIKTITNNVLIFRGKKKKASSILENRKLYVI
jgi:hypothetical protein